jgi:hypothetical protein
MKRVIFTYIGLLCLCFTNIYGQSDNSIERFALYVASNQGGEGREQLRYAGSDAMQMANTMTEIGGVSSANTLVLIDPDRNQIQNALETVGAAVEAAATKAKRTEFLFYYSGHSDEISLLLGDETYDYSSLKAAINLVPSDVHVVMLDSCFSGNFIRAKGGQRQLPFLFDDSSVVQGHAYLSSSSEKESSQESDSIQGSFFTHSLISGLRGAADTSGDKKVSLNELYHYAFNDTLARTGESTIGPQHPSYNITLVGSGDLILTDISIAEAVLQLPSEAQGTYFIRTLNGKLVSEINKIEGTKMALALPAAEYNVTVVGATSTSQAIINLQKGQNYVLYNAGLQKITRTSGVARGNTVTEPEQTTSDIFDISTEGWNPMTISFSSGLTFLGEANENTLISINAFTGRDKNIMGIQANGFVGTISESLLGIQASGFVGTVGDSVRGLQASGFVSTTKNNFFGLQSSGFVGTIGGDFLGMQTSGFVSTAKNGRGLQSAGFVCVAKDFDGAQFSGFANIAHDVKGFQASGFLNIAHSISGVQLGVVNIAKDNTGASIGLLNFITNGIMSPAVYADNSNYYVQYQGGTNAFYTTFLVGTNRNWDFDYTIHGFGIGARLGKRFLSLDLEILSKFVLSKDLISEIDAMNIEFTQNEKENEIQCEKIAKALSTHLFPSARASLNFSIFKHFSIFVSASADLCVKGSNDKAFSYWEQETPKTWTWDDQEYSLYPSYSIGIKF